MALPPNTNRPCPCLVIGVAIATGTEGEPPVTLPLMVKVELLPAAKVTPEVPPKMTAWFRKLSNIAVLEP